MAIRHSRRSFLRTLPVAATGLALSSNSLEAAAQDKTPPAPFQLFTAEQLATDSKALEGKPGNNNLVDLKPVTVVLTTEVAHSAKEFEWHENRDHIFQIVSGTTVYELGGTPKGSHSNGGKPGEWNAPESEGATRLTLRKGDMLTIPRNTPHKRSTEASVTFVLISPQGVV